VLRKARVPIWELFCELVTSPTARPRSGLRCVTAMCASTFYGKVQERWGRVDHQLSDPALFALARTKCVDQVRRRTCHHLLSCVTQEGNLGSPHTHRRSSVVMARAAAVLLAAATAAVATSHAGAVGPIPQKQPAKYVATNHFHHCSRLRQNRFQSLKFSACVRVPWCVCWPQHLE
jgi:hypothetical protein